MIPTCCKYCQMTTHPLIYEVKVKKFLQFLHSAAVTSVFSHECNFESKIGELPTLARQCASKFVFPVHENPTLGTDFGGNLRFCHQMSQSFGAFDSHLVIYRNLFQMLHIYHQMYITFGDTVNYQKFMSFGEFYQMFL